VTEPVDFLTETFADGSQRTRLDRLTDGRVMCCLCFEYVTRDQLNPLPDGMVEDVCQTCAAAELQRQTIHASLCGPDRGGFRVCYCTEACCHPIRDGQRVCICAGCRATPQSAGNRKDQT
jgi:hypothetical protein